MGGKEAIWVHFKRLDIGTTPIHRTTGGQEYELHIRLGASFEENIKRMEDCYLYRLSL